MLKRHNQFFKSLMVANDLVFLSLSWWLAFLFRFHSGLISLPAVYVFRDYVVGWLLILLTWGVLFELLALYRPRRISTHLRETVDIVKGSALALLIFLGVIFLLHDIILSRVVVLLFWVASVGFLNLSHVVCREGLRFLRRRGYNLRYVLVIGSRLQASRLIHKLQWHRHLGLNVTAVYLTDRAAADDGIPGVKLLKDRQDLARLVRSGDIDQVFITLSLDESSRLREIEEWLGDEPISLYFVPDLGEFAKLQGAVERFDEFHVITLQDSPQDGWNSVLKRTMDLGVGGLALILFSPLMAMIALAIKLTSHGPVIYRQERMGLDGKRFSLLKFRTMIEDAEKATGPIWAKVNDPRVTPVGKWLRRTSLDELPQLINVLKGEMSLVGPRPERPPLIEEFRRSVPKYMLRHKVKAGITGWAQVNGWRGNSSLERRIEHDIDYIQNWSLWGDVKILARTLLVGFRDKRASH
ncbi:MAG: undecaprenyl-phosphate glucose phosphotransferase [Alphaproteobacteria bacterium]